MTKDKERRILESIAECDRFIAKEGPRDARLRPVSVAQTLHFYEQHRLKLIAMLASAA